MTPESKVVLALQLALGTRPDCWLRRTNHGKARVLNDAGHTVRAVEFGEDGQADFELHLPGGQVWFIETKRARGTQYQDQKRFQAKVEAFGGFYFLVGHRDGITVEGLVAHIDAWCAGNREAVERTIAARRRLGA